MHSPSARNARLNRKRPTGWTKLDSSVRPTSGFICRSINQEGVELLAPAGSKESLKAAILGGADAVYLGGKQYGARRLAENFTSSELKGAVKLAHDHGAAVFVTVNTLIKEKELSSVFSHLDTLSSIEVDAFIVQDRGVLKMIKDHFRVPVHASTQMGVHSPECAMWAERSGIDRAILAREPSFEQLERIRAATSIGLEVFIHGALCYSVSGQCLFSSIVGGRSGNRGMCAQPCRKSYVLGKERGYLLSTADLLSVESIPRLLQIGVDALKIEGRMRSPVYVYLATRIYKAAIERAERGECELISKRERELLETAFNRGFTRGYTSETEIMSRSYPDTRGIVLGEGKVEGRLLRMKKANLRKGDGVTLYRDGRKAGGFEIGSMKESGGMLELRPPFLLEPGRYLVHKTRDREFAHIEERIEALDFPRCRAEKSAAGLELPEKKRQRSKGDISFYLSSLKSLESVLPYATRVYFESGRQFDDALDLCESAGVEAVLMLPRFTPTVPEASSKAIMVCTLGQIHKYANRRLYGHYSLNFFNSLTLPNLHQYVLSVELSREDVRGVLDHYGGRLEIMAFGRIELMITKDPTIAEGLLRDERGKRFQVYR
ncbi:MAG: U32 family peptidase, partial [Euryarchaeota archaeon]|nr:U32 family peptidase [Euryarchaeota archaeon]